MWETAFPEDMECEQDEEDSDVVRVMTTTAAPADTSSEVAKKLKEQFRKQVPVRQCLTTQHANTQHTTT